MNVIEKHPQRQQIIDMLLSGASTRKVGDSVTPKLHQSSVARFRLQLLAPAAAKLRGVQGKPKQIRQITDAAGITASPENASQTVKDAVRQEIQDSVSALDERFEKWISDAERRPVLDRLGEPVRDSDGSVLRMLEHKALASHARNRLSSLEFRAQLAGLMGDSRSTNVMIAFMSAGIDGAPAQVIEGQVESVEEGELRR